MDGIGQIHLFVKVVETGGFTAAARELGVPKSTVSRQIARLEDRLGVRLLERTTRALRTTEVGQAFYERCRGIVSDMGEAEAAVTQAQVVPQGTLRLSAPLTFGYLFLGELVSRFLLEYPELHVEVSLSDRKVDLIEEGYDVAIRAGTLGDSSMIARRLGSAEGVICASPTYLAARGTPTRPEDLKDHDCLLYQYQSSSSWRVGDTNVPVSGRLVSNNGDILRAAAVAGLGIANAPRFILGPELRAGRLVPVLQDHEQSNAGVWALYPHNRHLSAKVRAFVDFAVAHFGNVPPWELCED